MIAKVGSSTSIKGTIDYLENSTERVDWKATQHLASDDKEFVIGQMESTAEMSRTDQPIYHYSISWDEADNPTRGQMEAVARQTLKDLGMEDHQALIVTHNDHDYPHLHVMANRVHPEQGTAWSIKMDYKVLEETLRHQERAYGWKEVPGHHCQLDGQQKPEYGNALNRKEAARVKSGQRPFYMNVRQAASPHFRQATSWQDLHHRLAELELTIQRGSRGTGGKVTDGYNVANLSKVHRDFSMGRLEKRLGPFKSLADIRKGKDLTKVQRLFAGYEQACRLNKKGKEKAFKKALNKTLKGAATAKKLHGMLDSMLSVSTPANPAFKGALKLGKSILKQLKPNHERGR